MGLFSSKYVTTVATSVSRVIQDELLPNSVKTGSIAAMLSYTDIGDNIVENLVDGLALKSNRMYSYGRDKYAYGLPSGEYLTVDQGIAEVEAVLQAIEGTSVEIEYSRFGPPNNMHIAWMRLIEQYGYDPVTNKINSLSTALKPVYLHDMVIEVPADTINSFSKTGLVQWGYPANSGQSPSRIAWTPLSKTIIKPSPVKTVQGLAVERAKFYTATEVTVSTFDSNIIKTALISSGTVIDLGGFDNEADYFHVKYTVGSVVKYVMLKSGSGVYPALDNVMNNPSVLFSEFYPIAYFRYNKADDSLNKTTNEYKTSKKLVKFLGMDYDDIAEAINENPDIGDIEQAMLMMAVPAKTSNSIEQRYLFEFFSRMFNNDPNKLTFNARATLAGAGADDVMTGRKNNSFSTAIVIKDSRFKMAFANEGILRKTVAGAIGPVGSFASSYTASSISIEVEDQDFEGSPTSKTVAVPLKIHTYQKQTSSSTYTQYQVINLNMTYFIYGNYNDIGDGEEAILLVPLDYTVVSKYTMLEREEITSRSLHYIFNSRVVTKVKWYQQDWFADFLLIGGIVLTIVTLGAAGGLVSTINAAIIMGGNALLILAVQVVLISVLIQVGFKLFVKAVGPEFAAILAVVFMAVGAYQGIQSGSLAGAPWAKDLLSLSTNLTKAIGAVLSDQMQGLKQDFLNFSDFMKEANKELDVANKLLDNKDSWLSPIIIFGESPSEYFQRTVHSGNIGVIGLAAVGGYVENALTLPRIEQTIEGI